jgi:hypothetical protein
MNNASTTLSNKQMTKIKIEDLGKCCNYGHDFYG